MHRFSFFNRLSLENQSILLAAATKTTIPKEHLLFHQGDTCRQILFLVEGSIRVFRRHDSGQEITLYYLKPFEQCNVNINSAFGNTPAIGSAISESELEGYMIDANVLHTLYRQEQAYQDYVFSLFSIRLEEFTELVEDIRFKKLDERLMQWLQDTPEQTLTITHEKLASHIGTSREVVSRLLKTLEKEGVITLSRGKITKCPVQKSSFLKWF
ncbi:Crp/Fnr family transcriptional regulator [Sulfurospirillum sp. T05]|uniref:Crp/Fnr family transcriptional regulator n=1 Tax=Sulfurospirillum tamanense TaxID=2813362 RepID=A0ABS2WPI9_9BACT|nr:Crp/Fnr family transcriptional regulator [Sulfurospirillum tamanensis]MBN2963323.1 Crp/Fnr family transcriptional regulator [Sulfurospirillum tamanensis]